MSFDKRMWILYCYAGVRQQKGTVYYPVSVVIEVLVFDNNLDLRLGLVSV
jgi:hypothetical protein